MWPSILLLVGLFVLFVLFLALFLKDIIIIGVNGLIIYLVFLRAYFEIKKRFEWKIYVAGFIVSVVVLLVLGDLFPLWPVTSLILVAFIVVQLLKFVKKVHNRAKKKGVK